MLPVSPPHGLPADGCVDDDDDEDDEEDDDQLADDGVGDVENDEGQVRGGGTERERRH